LTVRNPTPGQHPLDRLINAVANQWSLPGWSWGAMTNQAIVAGTIYYVPIYVSQPTDFDRIGVYVGVGDGAGGLLDCRIFEDGGRVPGSLLLSCGTLSTNANGAQEIVIAQTLGPGNYWLACRGDNTPSLQGFNTASMVKMPVTGLAASLSTVVFGEACVCGVSAAYADPAPAPDTLFSAKFAFMRLREA